MTARLPVPGSDNGIWGDILNTFLGVSHGSDGSLLPNAIQQAGGVTRINGKSPVSGIVSLTASDIGADAAGAAATAQAAAEAASLSTPSGAAQAGQVPTATGNGTASKWNSTVLLAPAPSGDTSGAADTAAINALLATGGKVALGPSSATNPYWINATLVVPGFGSLAGAGEYATYIKMAANANLAAMVINDAYLYNSGTPYSGNPVTISDLTLDGNKAANSSAGDGIILLSYRSLVRDVYLTGIKGNGLTFSDTNLTGTVIANSAVENRAVRVTIDNPGNRGVWVKDTGTSGKVTDGYLTGCIVNSPGGDFAIRVERSAGWFISHNHVYGCSQGGIYLDQFWDTFLHDNEVDGFGSNGGTNTYSGFQVQNVILGREGSIHDNQCSTNEISASTYAYYYVRCPAITVGISFHDNFAHKDSGAGVASVAYQFIASTGGQFTVYGMGNGAEGPTTPYTAGGGGVLNFADNPPGTASADDAQAVGAETMPALSITDQSVQFNSGDLALTYFTAPRGETVTQIKAGTGPSTPSGITYSAVGLYLVNGDGSLTLATSTANDTTLFSANWTNYSKSFQTPFQLTAGVRYALGVLMIGNALPGFYGNWKLNTQYAYAGNPRKIANVTGQSSLPATISANAPVVTRAVPIYAQVTP